MTLSEALDHVYGKVRSGIRGRRYDWTNPIEGMGSVTGVFQTPYEAYQELKPEYKQIVQSLIGRHPEPHEDLVGEDAYMDYEYYIDEYGDKTQKKALKQALKKESNE